MSSLVRVSKIFRKLPIQARVKDHQETRRSSHFHRDWRPGPYPMTQEERAAAAAKYNLLPEEYEPYDPYAEGACYGVGYGDYPKLPTIAFDDRDPYYPWTVPKNRMNWGEPMHVNQIHYSYLWPEITVKEGLSGLQILCRFCLVVGGQVLFFAGLSYIKTFPPILPRHAPHLGEFYYYPGTEELH